MTTQEIKALIAEKIAGQGSMVDVGGGLPAILNALCDLIPQVPDIPIDVIPITGTEYLGLVAGQLSSLPSGTYSRANSDITNGKLPILQFNEQGTSSKTYLILSKKYANEKLEFSGLIFNNDGTRFSILLNTNDSVAYSYKTAKYLPKVESSDNGKIMMVLDGEWAMGQCIISSNYTFASSIDTTRKEIPVNLSFIRSRLDLWFGKIPCFIVLSGFAPYGTGPSEQVCPVTRKDYNGNYFVYFGGGDYPFEEYKLIED